MPTKKTREAIQVKDVVESVEMLRATLNTVEKLYLQGRAPTQSIPPIQLRAINELLEEGRIRMPPPITGVRYCP